MKTLFRAFLLLTTFSWVCLAGEPASAVATVAAGYVTDITVTAPGSGYKTEPAVTVTGGGGTGATAKAILTGDRVGFIVVLSAGSGYKTAPLVAIEPPPQDWELAVRLVPEITVYGSKGAVGRVEWSSTLEPGAQSSWHSFTNILIGAEGVSIVDLVAGSSTRFYRATSGPAGFVYIQPGSFLMGSPTSEPDRGVDEMQHSVILTHGFWMSDHEVTQAEYELVMGVNPSYWKGATLPVERVTWDDAVAYCKKLTQRELAEGRITASQAYRLPTEAEWEYAARAGTIGAFYGALDSIAWYASNAGGKTHPVKTKQANAWGLYDMSGNVWEWCSDGYGAYPTTTVTDPTGAPSVSHSVIRGGSWRDGASNSRMAERYDVPPDNPGNINGNLGFRPVLGAGLPGSPALGERASQQATATASVTAGYVTDITLTSGGSGYSTPPDITIVGGGGQGAEAKAILNGDKVALVIVVNSGSGYTSIPVVTLGASSPEFELGVRLVPEISVSGPAGSVSRIEYVERLAPRVISEWQLLTNLVIEREGGTVVDLAAGSSARTYRLVAGVSAPSVPEGFVWISPGTFKMGSPTNEPFRSPTAETQHTVTLTRGYWMCDHEVTQTEYESVMGVNPSIYKGQDFPVESVNWFEATEYCRRLTEREVAAGRLTGDRQYRLPTEAEWEYACRAGTTTAYAGDLDALGWYDQNSTGRAHPVKTKQANAGGLYDMHGNAWEWCSDWLEDFSGAAVTDPTGAKPNLNRILRGGAYNFGAAGCRSATRGYSGPDNRYETYGFRIVLSSVN